METWLSGRKRFFAKEVSLKRAPRVRIPPSPPFGAAKSNDSLSERLDEAQHLAQRSEIK